MASVDTGSNAIRFFATRFTAPGRFEVLASERVPVRLGHQVFLRGRLAPEAMEAATQAFVSFRAQMDALGITHYRAVATSAIREAHNGDLLVERIFRESGIKLEVVTGSEEARLVHLAVSSRIDLKGGKWLLMDLGGGSVEVSLVDDAGMLWSESHTMGSVRLLEELSDESEDPGRLQRLLSEYVALLRIPAPAQYWSPTGSIATGGNMEALAKLAAAHPDDSGVSRLPVRDLEALIQLLARLSFRERMDQLGLREDRADVILPAAMVYHRLATLAGVEEILVPHVGVKEGVVLDLAADLTSHATHDTQLQRQLDQAAISLGRRFMFDEAHGVQVADLAMTLFDRMKDLHGLGPRDRQLLRTAALLHDIGTFISYKRHHKHSLYLIHRAELPGLSPTENLVVANVARYHRKSPPRPHHSEYMRLSPEERVRVDQLAALLRLADAMDRQHLQLVKEVELEVKGLSLLITLKGEGDLLLERWALSKKRDLFEETFGFQVKIHAG